MLVAQHAIGAVNTAVVIPIHPHAVEQQPTGSSGYGRPSMLRSIVKLLLHTISLTFHYGKYLLQNISLHNYTSNQINTHRHLTLNYVSIKLSYPGYILSTILLVALCMGVFDRWNGLHQEHPRTRLSGKCLRTNGHTRTGTHTHTRITCAERMHTRGKSGVQQLRGRALAVIRIYGCVARRNSACGLSEHNALAAGRFKGCESTRLLCMCQCNVHIPYGIV